MSWLIILVALACSGYSKRNLLSRFYDQATGTGRASGAVTGEARAIAQRMQETGVTLEDVEAALLELPTGALSAPALKRRDSGDVAVRIFSILGGLFIFSGISVFIGIFWGTLPSFVRVFATLGVGIGLSVLSVIAMKEGRYPRITLPLILIAAVIETGGWFVFIYEYFPKGGDIHKASMIVFAIMALQHAFIYYRFPRTVLAFLSIAFTYSFIYELLMYLGIRDCYIALLLGASLFITSHSMKRGPHIFLSLPAYIIAAVWFNFGLFDLIEYLSGLSWIAGMASSLSLGSMAWGLREQGVRRWPALGALIASVVFYASLFDAVRGSSIELLFLVFAIFMLYGSVLLRSGTILMTSSLAILGFIGYYSGKYFANSSAWPIALILMGVAFFGVSAVAMKIKRKHGL